MPISDLDPPDRPATSSGVSPLLVLACAALCLVGVFDHDLWTPDEPRVASISLEMNRTGDPVVPMLAGEPFVEKPPLYFAVAGWFVGLFAGALEPTVAIRLSTTMWSLGILLMTWLLAKRLLDRRAAWLSVALLATTVGFLENSHWIRVDVALAFFVTACVWAMAETWVGGRRWMCLAAGAFAAGAFLTKGPIGLVLIGLAWLGFALPAALSLWWGVRAGETSHRPARRRSSLGPHLLGLLVLVALCIPWILLLRQRGDAVWNEWFWENQVGRLTGSSTHLSHIRTGRPFYYVKTVLLYTLPWTPLLGPWLLGAVRSLAKRRADRSTVFLLFWCVASIVVLTLSATKRDLYLWPVMGAFVLMCAQVLSRPPAKWFLAWMKVWLVTGVVVLAALALAPLLVMVVPSVFHAVPTRLAEVLGHFGHLQAVAAIGAGILIVLLVVSRRSSLTLARALFGTAVFCAALLIAAGGALDREKSMKAGLLEFAAGIPEAERPHTAEWGFDETMRACFHYYAGWSVRRISDRKELVRILEGRDPQIHGVLMAGKYTIPVDRSLPPSRVVLEGRLDRKRVLQMLLPARPEGGEAGDAEGSSEGSER